MADALRRELRDVLYLLQREQAEVQHLTRLLARDRTPDVGAPSPDDALMQLAAVRVPMLHFQMLPQLPPLRMLDIPALDMRTACSDDVIPRMVLYL